MFGICGTQLATAEDFAAVFDTSYRGISLDTSHLGERQRVDRTDNLDVRSATLPGFQLSQDELSLVLKTTDPVGTGLLAVSDQGKRPLRIRLMDWITQGSQRVNIFSALVREKDESGMRLDIDPYSEEVVVEYRIGF